MGAYNRAITGSSFRMPHQEYHEQYAVAPIVLFRGDAEPDVRYRHEEQEQFFTEWARRNYETMRTPAGFLLSRAVRMIGAFSSIVGFGAIGLLWIRWVWDDWWLRLAAAGGVACLCAAMATKGAFTHYVAPATGILVLLSLGGMRALLERGGASGRRVLAAVAVGTLWVPVLKASTPRGSAAMEVFHTRRLEVRACLEQLDLPSLVLYEPSGDLVHTDWVANSPEPFASKVLWARAMNAERDALLMAATPDRWVWRADAHAGDPRDSEVVLTLLRYPVEMEAAEPAPCH